MALKDIKNKIRSVNKTRKVTKAMEAVSAVKMRKSQERALAGRPYARAALTILKHVSGSLDAVNHPLVNKRDVKNVCLIVVTSDKGLAGALNSALLKETHKLIAEKGWDKANLKLVTIGKKGYEHFSNRDFDIYANYPAPSDADDLDTIEGTVKEIVGGYLDETFDECHILYTNFKSTFEANPVARKLLPSSFDAIEETIKGITPEKGKFAEEVAPEKEVATYTVEPNPESVFSILIPKLVQIEIYHGLLEASASEHSSRMVAMKNASDKAGEISRDLNLKYNKARQAIITREVSEIVGGMETSS